MSPAMSPTWTAARRRPSPLSGRLWPPTSKVSCLPTGSSSFRTYQPSAKAKDDEEREEEEEGFQIAFQGQDEKESTNSTHLIFRCEGCRSMKSLTIVPNAFSIKGLENPRSATTKFSFL